MNYSMERQILRNCARSSAQGSATSLFRWLDMLIQEAILGVQGVQGVQDILSYASSYAGPRRTYTATNIQVQTTYGIVGLEGVTFGP